MKISDHIEFMVRTLLGGIGILMVCFYGIMQIIEWKFAPQELDHWVILFLLSTAHWHDKE